MIADMFFCEYCITRKRCHPEIVAITRFIVSRLLMNVNGKGVLPNELERSLECMQIGKRQSMRRDDARRMYDWSYE